MPKVTFEIVQHDGGWAYKVKEIAPRVVRVAFLFNPETAPFAEFYLTPLQSRRLVLGSRGDRSACSRRVLARICHCRTGGRTQWGPYRDAGDLPECTSRGGHIAMRPRRRAA